MKEFPVFIVFLLFMSLPQFLIAKEKLKPYHLEVSEVYPDDKIDPKQLKLLKLESLAKKTMVQKLKEKGFRPLIKSDTSASFFKIFLYPRKVPSSTDIDSDVDYEVEISMEAVLLFQGDFSYHKQRKLASGAGTAQTAIDETRKDVIKTIEEFSDEAL